MDNPISIQHSGFARDRCIMDLAKARNAGTMNAPPHGNRPMDPTPDAHKEMYAMTNSKKPDPATMQTAAGAPKISQMNTAYVFQADEVQVLRDLAQQVQAIAQRESEAEKARLWTMHNDLTPERPMIFADPENGWNEIITTADLQCHQTLARVWEMHLRRQIFWANEMQDDKVIEATFDVPYVYTDTGWGMDIVKETTDAADGSYHIIPPIQDYAADLPKIQFPQIVVDIQQSGQILELAHNIFDGILDVRRRHSWWWTLGMTWDFMNLRGLDNLMMDLILQPDQVHAVMRLLMEGTLNRLDFLQDNGYLSSNTGGAYVGSGGFGWTEQLPKANDIQGPVRTQDMWGFCESQETVGVSPSMFNEFILPYQLPILERFGLNCYGCCEPIDARWDYVKQIPRLRRVSASPWADKEMMARQLGRDYILSIKPNPALLATPVMDEDAVRKELTDSLRDAKGAIIEVIMKDNHTLGNNPRHITRWVEIAREVVEDVY